MSAVVAIAQAVKILTGIAMVAVLALCVVSASTVPNWCDAPQRLAGDVCVSETPRVVK